MCLMSAVLVIHICLQCQERIYLHNLLFQGMLGVHHMVMERVSSLVL